MVKKNNNMEGKQQDPHSGRQAIASAGTLEKSWPEETYGDEPGFSSRSFSTISEPLWDYISSRWERFLS